MPRDAPRRAVLRGGRVATDLRRGALERRRRAVDVAAAQRRLRARDVGPGESSEDVNVFLVVDREKMLGGASQTVSKIRVECNGT